jgi:hypothetical protein
VSNLELLCAELEAEKSETAAIAEKKAKKKSNKTANKKLPKKQTKKAEYPETTDQNCDVGMEIVSKSGSREHLELEEEKPIDELHSCEFQNIEQCPKSRQIKDLPKEPLLLMNLISSSSSTYSSTLSTTGTDNSKLMLTSSASGSFDHANLSYSKYNATGSISSSNYSSFCCLSYDCDCNDNFCAADEANDDWITEEEKNEYYANKDILLHERMTRRELLRQQFQNLKLNSNFKIRPRNVS